MYQCTSVPSTHRTFPRFARAAIDSHVQHDSLTRTKIFSSKSAAAVIFRQEARGRGGFNPLGWAIPIIFCLAAFGGSLGAEGSLSLVADCGFGRSSCGSTSATFPFPQTPERNPVSEEVSGANHHIIGLPTPPQPLLLRVSCREKQASRWILENKLLFLSRCQFHAYTATRGGCPTYFSLWIKQKESTTW